jgi:hypothetical protein
VFRHLGEDLGKGAPSDFDLGGKLEENIAIRRELASELLLRYGNSVSNQIHRLPDRIERLQRMRQSQPVAPRIDVSLA